MPRFSVIIPTYNHLEDLLKPCLESIRKYTTLNDNIEILVIGNGCTDGTDGYVDSLEDQFHYYGFMQPLGFTAAVNEGLRYANGDYIVLLNNDTILLEQEKDTWLNMLYTPFKFDPLMGITGPYKMQWKGLDKDRWFMVFFCAMIKAGVFDKIGILDEQFKSGYGVDPDFCFKAQDAGYLMHTVSQDFPLYHRDHGTYDVDSERGKLFEEGAKLIESRYKKVNSTNTTGITAYVPTKDRYDSLYTTLMSLVDQTVKPEKILIFDDGEKKDLRNDYRFRALFNIMGEFNIQWEVVFNNKPGQVWAHQTALEMCTTNLLFRTDDDVVLQRNALERMSEYLVQNPECGAAAPLVIVPGTDFKLVDSSSKLEHLDKPNSQWCKDAAGHHVDAEHLHCTFMYRKEAGKHGYNMNLSPVGFREETMFTHTMFLNGWKLHVDTDQIAWHIKAESGGTRVYDPLMYQRDEEEFKRYLAKINVGPKQDSFAYLDSGMGDHIMFRSILPDLQKKVGGQVTIACCYPELFNDFPNVKLISIAEGKQLYGNLVEKYNVYRWCSDNNWAGSMVEAFRQVYQC